jgi:uncharacterized membrane protein
MADVLSRLLLIGVGVSAATLTVGLLLLLATGRTGYGEGLTPALLFEPQGSVAFPHTLDGVIRGALALRPFAVIELGVLLLIATPVFRVAASAVLFFLEGDRLYTVITLVVLGLLLASVFWLGGPA